MAQVSTETCGIAMELSCMSVHTYTLLKDNVVFVFYSRVNSSTRLSNATITWLTLVCLALYAQSLSSIYARCF